MLIDKILIVGYGSIGKRHLRLARTLFPNATIAVLRHQETDDVPEHANKCFHKIEEAIAFAPHIAIIANPATQHINIAQTFAELGAHLLIEKPLSTSTVGIQKLIETCKEKESTLMTGYNLRFLKSLEKFRNYILEDKIGTPFSVRCEIGQHLSTWRPDTDYRNSVSAKKNLGGGALLELSHEIDYLRWIFGEVEWVQASLSHQSNLEIDVEDTVHIIMGFVSSYQKKLIASLNIDFIRHDTTRTCTAIGEKGTIKWDGISGKISFFAADANQWQDLYSQTPQRDESYINEWHSFIKCIKDNTPTVVSGLDGLRVIELVEAIRESSAKGTKIQLQKNKGSL